MSPRATPLPPAERRTAIVGVALDLIARRGTMPTTREIADEAGIAEGTIFRAFDTKERLVEAVVGQAFCPAPIAHDIDAVDMTEPLRDRLVDLVVIMQRRFSQVFGVMTALGLTAPPPEFEHHRGCRADTGHVPVDEQDPDTHTDWQLGRSVSVIGEDADQLTCTPEELLSYLRLLTFSASHPEISWGQTLPPETIVGIVLDGVLRPATRPATRKAI